MASVFSLHLQFHISLQVTRQTLEDLNTEGKVYFMMT